MIAIAIGLKVISTTKISQFVDPVAASHFQSWNLKANYHVTTSLIALTFTMTFNVSYLQYAIAETANFRIF